MQYNMSIAQNLFLMVTGDEPRSGLFNVRTALTSCAVTGHVLPCSATCDGATRRLPMREDAAPERRGHSCASVSLLHNRPTSAFIGEGTTGQVRESLRVENTSVLKSNSPRLDLLRCVCSFGSWDHD